MGGREREENKKERKEVYYKAKQGEGIKKKEREEKGKRAGTKGEKDRKKRSEKKV